MKHFRLLTVGLSLIIQQAMWAGPRTYQQAQAIAERQAAQMGVTISKQAKARSFSAAKFQSSASSKESLTASGTAAYYVFPYGEDKGFAIVSGDDQMPEIIAYSDKGTFDENNMPETCRNFLKAYKQMVEAAAKGDKHALKTIAQKRSFTGTKEYQQPTVAPLLGELAWNTSSPFNNLCPKYCYAGSASVAMAQVMKYWEYPKELKEDIPAYTSYTEQVPDEKYEIGQFNKGETYDWDNMLPVYNPSWEGINYNDEQANAVAKLVAHCGAAVQTIYTRYDCLAGVTPEAFIKYFGYDPDTPRLIYRGSYGYGDWCKLIDQELIAKRPVIYSGFNGDYNFRVFVCDGADGNGLYHINWGLGPDCNGYYDITILAPNDEDLGNNTDFLGYNRDCSIIIGLQPDNGVKDEPLIQVQALNVLADDRNLAITKAERGSASETFALTYTTNLANYQPENFRGLVDVGYKDDKGNYIPLSKESTELNIFGMSVTSSYWATGAFDEEIDYAFPVGTTIIYDIYSTDEGKTWQPCSYMDESYPYEVVATETTLSIVKENDDFQTTLQPLSDFMVNRAGYWSYTMHNQNSHDYYGAVKISCSHTADMSAAKEFNTDYVNIKAGGSTTHTFFIYPEEAGDLYIWIYDLKHEKMLVDGQKFTVAEAPKLKFLSKSINVKENTYERENAYYQYNKRVAMPVIDGDEAIVKYMIQNDGSSININANLVIDTYAKDEEESIVNFGKEYFLEGGGATTELVYRFKASDLNGRKSFRCRLNLDFIYSREMDFSQIPTYPLYSVDDPDSYVNIINDKLVGYFSDTPTGISTVSTASGIQITAGKGYLAIVADKAQFVSIYNLAGQCVSHLNLQPNKPTTISLPSGIYVIGKKKVTVR